VIQGICGLYEIKNPCAPFPFSCGLSYTQFEYTDLQTTTIPPNGDKIKSVGDAAGYVVASQISRLYCLGTQGFAKDDLGPVEKD